MADKKVRMSDLSENLADKRVTWGFGARRYVIDLTDEEYAGFEAAVKPYLEASRPAPRKKRQTST